MEATNCPRCGRMFMKISKPLCPDCEKADEEKFEVVRAFVKENPDCTIHEVSKECEISVKRIMKYVREGQLEVSKGMQDAITCTKCGKPIDKGSMCEKCSIAVASSISDMRAQDAVKNKGRVFTRK